MAKLRIFVSSTYYDLKHIRDNLKAFIDGFGYEPVLYESGDITFKHYETLDDACYNEIKNCHMQVLIIGGRYGSEVSKTKSAKQRKPPVKENDTDDIYKEYNSITRQEYKTALEQNIPVFIFIEKQVLAEYETYKKNVDNQTIKYAHVQNVNVFKLIEEIHSRLTGNFIRGFEKFEDISDWLRIQWSGMFADFLKNDKDKIEIESLSAKIDELSAVSNALKKYSEELLRSAEPEKSEGIIEGENRKFQDEKIKWFNDESFVSMLKMPYKNYLNILSPNEIYEKFITSTNYYTFLESLKFTQEDIFYQKLLEEQGINTMPSSYKKLKLKYQNTTID